ncbi:MAG: type III-B CRISPR module RAMP protein Cmr4 [gamma proteobacterium endosymbiont of Lamellibrachia anaximandri]|nr:type III-B CRISPR module RAMP protein Cmr4 [gamma proteobacterium endosymbiont of Lamellibrachia anaximandri]MBL3535490.1 type III-B CRISPR module RAMP protein Cmr4 [gamma proteobacterium endosymbiont of Lamellibrachia anaximandri]
MSTQGARANAMIGLYTETSLHAGMGQSTGVVDLPIQREGHNGWPCVFGSGVKGALRAKAAEETEQDEEKLIELVFGPDTNNASEHAGSLSVGDARLLLMPIRSLTSSFKWVTCPEALARLKRDAERLGIEMPALPESVKTIQASQALVPERAGDLFLEEYLFESEISDLSAVIAVLTKLLTRDDAEQALQERLVVISNDMFAHLCQHGTPVNAHIRLEENKTVATGALWYEETLPPDTLLYVPLSAAPARRKEATQPADAMLGFVSTLFATKPWLQLGGNETVGMGWCRVSEMLGAE